MISAGALFIVLGFGFGLFMLATATVYRDLPRTPFYLLSSLWGLVCGYWLTTDVTFTQTVPVILTSFAGGLLGFQFAWVVQKFVKRM